MKKIILLLAVFMLSQLGFTQTTYYWYKGIKKELRLNNKKKFILISSSNDTIPVKKELLREGYTFSRLTEAKVAFEPFTPGQEINVKKYWTIIEDNEPIDILDNNIEYIAPFFYTEDNSVVGLSNIFYVKLNSLQDLPKLEQMANVNKVKILGNNKYMPLWVTLSCTKQSKGNALQMANVFYESNLFAASEPDILVENITNCVNDNYFSQQWGLDNQGQNNGVAGIDIKLCEVRKITQGNPNIIVAVLDHGVELNHLDLTNMYHKSFDTETGTSPSQIRGNHGTACAGIIGATVNNSIGVVGIAPNSPIMSISNRLTNIPDIRIQLANGINFATNNNASVISNSWGSNSLKSEIIDDAINNALVKGRNGKGCVVVFSAGNSNQSTVEYPSSLKGVISVGAIDRCGIRSGRIDIVPQSCDPWANNSSPGSSYGGTLSVVAPGTKVYTTDLTGQAGYNSDGDYTPDFGGTSAACPHVAGVAALILSVNPNLTGQQVRDIIEKTAQKVRTDLYTYTNNTQRPNGAWNNEMGYGLVDAYAAVKMAKSKLSELYIRDDKNDDGYEPNPSFVSWISPDIWLTDKYDRQVYTAPIYANDFHKVAVRVKNIGSKPVEGARLFVHWTSNTFNSKWVNSWIDESVFGSQSNFPYTFPWANIPKGGAITEPFEGMKLPTIQPGEEKIIYVPWDMSFYDIYHTLFKIHFNDLERFDWGFSLLAAIDDGNEYPLYSVNYPTTEFAKNYNNVATHNARIHLISNWNTQILPFGDIIKSPFVVRYTQLANEGHVLSDFAEVYAVLSNDMIRNLNLEESKGIKRVSENMVILTSPEAELHFYGTDESAEFYAVGAQINFISDKLPQLNDFDFDITLHAIDDEGKPYQETRRMTAVRNPDIYFKAIAEADRDKVVKNKESVVLNSNVLADSAKYVWFDQSGSKIGEGSQITVSPQTSQVYTVSITKDEDGYRSYGEVEVQALDGIIKSLSPNPANDNVTVVYELSDNVANASIQISNIEQTITTNHTIVGTATSQTIPLSGYSSGVYMVKLLIDGVVVDSKQLIIY